MKIIYPPRPKGKLNPAQLGKMNTTGLCVQRKLNGERNLVHRSANGTISIYSRYGRPHQRYKMPPFLRKELSALNFESGQEYWLDGELLHNKVENTVRDTIFLYDVLQAGKYLFGMPLSRRLEILKGVCRDPSDLADPPLGLKVSEHVWMAETWTSNFVDRFQDYLHLRLVEGLVVKKLDAGLDSYGHQPYDVSWQWRCRKPGHSYLN